MTSEDRSLEVDFSRISNDNIIPFGKYRGMPVEVLADDPEYVEWLQAQPWFRARYQKIHTRVFHNFREPDETPAHNLIQARFLDQEFMRKMFLGIQHARASESQSIKRLFDISEEKKDLRIQVRWVLKTIKKTRDDLDKWYRTEYKTDEQLYQDFLNQKLSKRHWESYLYDWRRQYEKYEEVRKLLPLARQAQRGLRSFKTQIISWSFQSLFEQKAIDVTLSVTVRFKYPSVYIGDRYYDDHDWTRGRQNLFAVYNSNQSWEYSIEIKPQLGDDYPAVLRQILASKSNVLLVNEFQSDAITWNQLKSIFATAKCRVFLVSEIEAINIDSLDMSEETVEETPLPSPQTNWLFAKETSEVDNEY